MVDEPGSVSLQRRIDHKIVIDPEHVTAADAAPPAHSFVFLLSLVCQYRSDDFASVFYHHVTWKEKLV